MINNETSLAQATKQVSDNLTAHFEWIKVNAKLIRCKYLSLVEQGFSKGEALELCLKM